MAEPPAARSAAGKRPDAIDPTGIVEGPIEVFGLRFPLRSIIARRTSTTAVVDIPIAFEQVSNYLRARLQSDQIDIGPKSTIFNKATIVGATDSGTLHVIIRRSGQTARVTIMKHTGPTQPSRGVRNEDTMRFDASAPHEPVEDDEP